jgi:hypothetical protein
MTNTIENEAYKVWVRFRLGSDFDDDYPVEVTDRSWTNTVLTFAKKPEVDEYVVYEGVVWSVAFYTHSPYSGSDEGKPIEHLLLVLDPVCNEFEEPG